MNKVKSVHYLTEEGSEHNNRYLRYNREHHSRQNSLQNNLLDTFLRDCHTCSPKILRIIEESNSSQRSDIVLSQAVIDLLDTDNPAENHSESSDLDE